MLKFGGSNIGSIYFETTKIGKAYLGPVLVFQKGTVSRLPAGYTELYYVSFSSSYINTGLYPNNNWSISAKWSRDSSDAMYFYGSLSSGNSYSCTAYLQQGGAGNWRWKNRYAAINSSVAIHETTQDNTGVTMDGVHMNYTGSVSAFTAVVSLALGCQHNADGTYGTGYFDGKVYSFTISQSGETIMDLVPCKNSSNVVGLYDLVSDQFFTSLGSPFIAGPIK